MHASSETDILQIGNRPASSKHSALETDLLQWNILHWKPTCFIKTFCFVDRPASLNIQHCKLTCFIETFCVGNRPISSKHSALETDLLQRNILLWKPTCFIEHSALETDLLNRNILFWKPTCFFLNIDSFIHDKFILYQRPIGDQSEPNNTLHWRPNSLQ